MKSPLIKKTSRVLNGGGLLRAISLSLIGVGFSSWTVSISYNDKLSSIEGDGQISDLNRYISRKNQFTNSSGLLSGVNTSNFKFSKSGFLNQYDEIGVSDTGVISVPFSLLLPDQNDTLGKHRRQEEKQIVFSLNIEEARGKALPFLSYFDITPSLSMTESQPGSYNDYQTAGLITGTTENPNPSLIKDSSSLSCSFAFAKDTVQDKNTFYFLTKLSFKLKDSSKTEEAYDSFGTNGLNLVANISAEGKA